MTSRLSRQVTPGQVKQLLRELGVFAVLAAGALGTWHVVSPRSSPISYFLRVNALPAIPRPQRPLTLDPGLFTGRIAEGYRVARERPWLIEKMPCYCGCYLTDGHQNNLDCFRDRHSENCELCLVIALRADQLDRAGYAVQDIKKLIDHQYAPRGN